MPLTRLKEEYLDQDGVRCEPLLLPQAIRGHSIDLASGESLRDAGRVDFSEPAWAFPSAKARSAAAGLKACSVWLRPAQTPLGANGRTRP